MGETYRDESFAFFTFAFCGGRQPYLASLDM